MSYNLMQKSKTARVRSLFPPALMLACALGTVTQVKAQVTPPTTPAHAQPASTRGRVISPQSNGHCQTGIGVRAHNNVELLIPSGTGPTASPVTGFDTVTPATITP